MNFRFTPPINAWACRVARRLLLGHRVVVLALVAASIAGVLVLFSSKANLQRLDPPFERSSTTSNQLIDKAMAFQANPQLWFRNPHGYAPKSYMVTLSRLSTPDGLAKTRRARRAASDLGSETTSFAGAAKETGSTETCSSAN